MVRISHRDDETKAATPSRTHANPGVTASTGRLIGAIDVGGDFNKIDQKVRYVSDQPPADIFEFESNVLRSPVEGKTQDRIFARSLCSTAQNETLRHGRLSACAIPREAF